MPILHILERKVKALNHFLAGDFGSYKPKRFQIIHGKVSNMTVTFFFKPSDLFIAPEGLKVSGMFTNTTLTLYPLRAMHSLYTPI